MKSVSWSLVKLILVIFFAFIFKSSFAEEDYQKFWSYIGYFVNLTPERYIVYQSCNPASTPSEREWEQVLSLLPYNHNDKSKYFVGTTDDKGILLKDPLLNGCVIKIAPGAPNSKGSTFYIKGGIKSSGNCKYNWLLGPYNIKISPVDFDILDEVRQKSSKDKMPTYEECRYCGYRNCILGVVIYPTGELEFVARNRSSVIDNNKFSLYETLDNALHADSVNKNDSDEDQ